MPDHAQQRLSPPQICVPAVAAGALALALAACGSSGSSYNSSPSSSGKTKSTAAAACRGGGHRRARSGLDRAGEQRLRPVGPGDGLHAEAVILAEAGGGGETDVRSAGGVDAEGTRADLAALVVNAPELVDGARGG